MHLPRMDLLPAPNLQFQSGDRQTIDAPMGGSLKNMDVLISSQQQCVFLLPLVQRSVLTETVNRAGKGSTEVLGKHWEQLLAGVGRVP